MNKNGIVAVVVVITAVVLVGLWVMRSGQTRPGGRQFDCTEPPQAPSNFTHTKSGNLVTGTWTAPTGSNPPTAYLIESGGAPGVADQGVSVVPATQTSLRQEAPPGVWYVRIYARNACGTSPASNEEWITIP